MNTRFHLSSLVVALVLIRCYSLSFVVTLCHSLYHSLPFFVTLVVILCHLLSLNVSLVCLFKKYDIIYFQTHLCDIILTQKRNILL